ncbi:UDP-glucuronosyltransferase 2C1-like [Asterias amurensis]|uniref:UDP-glucuronosyltransferase 2C1-like n=1 Tax=Asterias amurensis TaxID=7602 RepID=UPI003AB3A154
MAEFGKIFVPLAFMLICLSFTANCRKPKESTKVLKFLFYTAGDDGSHHAVSAKIAASLVEMGHDVTFLLSNSCTKWMNASDAGLFKFTVHKSKFTADDRQSTLRDISRASLRGELKGLLNHIWYRGIKQWFKPPGQKIDFNFATDCDSLLGDNDTIKSLQAEKFDILVGEDLSECQPLLAQRLGLRFLHISARGFMPARGDWHGIPSHPAYIPTRQAGLTDRMNFLQRLKNVYMYGVHKLANHLQVQYFFAHLQQKYNLSPELYMSEMLAKAELQIFIGDFELEFARPLQPNTIMVVLPLLFQDLPTSPEQEIPQDIQDFLDTVGDEGAVLFSLGSHVNEMEAMQAQLFSDGFARLPQRVLWQFTGNTSYVRFGNNTKLVKWMPQKQLMNHPKVKAFVNHGGLLGVLEAGWYGLPMVGIPLFGNHFDNMERVVAKGMGLKLEVSSMTHYDLYEAVTRVITEPRFRERAQHISGMMRDQLENPADKAAFWVAHVTKFGGGHLRPRSADITWVQYYLIDVYAFLGAILFAVMWLFFLVLRCYVRFVIRYCTTPQKVKQN